MHKLLKTKFLTWVANSFWVYFVLIQKPLHPIEKPPARPLRAFHCSCAFQSPLSWLPNMAPTIGGLTILMSASTLADGVSPDIALDAAIRRGAENVRLEPLTHEEAKRCIAEKLAQFGKKLDDAQMTELLRRRDCTLPLFIRALCAC